MVDDSDSGGSIKVTDRRLFSADGSRRVPEQPEAGAETGTGRDPGVIEGPEFTARPAPGPEEVEGALPDVDFSTLVLSFRTSALVHLGLVPDPAVGASAVNLDGARQMIDILTVLEEKTRGNLSREEQQLIQQVLTELRMQFVNVSSPGGPRR